MADTCCRCSFSDLFNVSGKPFANRSVGISLEFSLWVWTTLFCVIFNVCFFHLNRTYFSYFHFLNFGIFGYLCRQFALDGVEWTRSIAD